MNNEAQKLNELEQQTRLFGFRDKTKKYLIFISIAFLFWILETAWQDLTVFSILDMPIVFDFLLVWLFFNAFYSRSYNELFLFSLIIYILKSARDILLTWDGFGTIISGFFISLYYLSYGWIYLIIFLLGILLLNKISRNKLLGDGISGFIIFVFFGSLFLFLMDKGNYSINLFTALPFSMVIKIALFKAFLNSLIIAPIFYYLLPKFKIIRIYFLKTNE